MQVLNILLVSGTGKNSGKTTIVRRILQNNSQHSIFAVKISPHRHPIDEHDHVLGQTAGYAIIEEKNISGKDSSLFLQAGASQSFFVQSDLDCLFDAWQVLCGYLPACCTVICESSSLLTYMSPQIHIVATGALMQDATSLASGAACIPVSFLDHSNVDKIKVVNGAWTI